jgi:hypothetical protein
MYVAIWIIRTINKHKQRSAVSRDTPASSNPSSPLLRYILETLLVNRHGIPRALGLHWKNAPGILGLTLYQAKRG